MFCILCILGTDTLYACFRVNRCQIPLPVLRSEQVKIMETKKFERFRFVLTVGLSGDIYYGDPGAVLRNQFCTRDCRSFISDPYVTEVPPHVMNSDIGNGACGAAENAIKSHFDEAVNWRRKEMNGEDSFIAAVQVFRYNSETSLKAESLTFYPLHITAVNFI